MHHRLGCLQFWYLTIRRMSITNCFYHIQRVQPSPLQPGALTSGTVSCWAGNIPLMISLLSEVFPASPEVLIPDPGSTVYQSWFTPTPLCVAVKCQKRHHLPRLRRDWIFRLPFAFFSPVNSNFELFAPLYLNCAPNKAYISPLVKAFYRLLSSTHCCVSCW